MAIAVELNYPGGTIEQYDEAVRRLGGISGGRHPGGAMFHWAAKTDDGFRVVDVWESKAAFDRFAQEKIGPISQEIGMDQPEMRFVDIHSYLTG